jgi:hypothetical protein
MDDPQSALEFAFQVMAIRTHHDQRVSPGDPSRDGFAQRPGRDGAAITETGRTIDDDQPQIVRQLGVLQAIVHDDRAGAGGGDGAGALGPLPRDPANRVTRQHQGLVADIRRHVQGRVHPDRAAQPAAISPREDRGH